MKKLILFFPLFLFAVMLDFSNCYSKYKNIKTEIKVSKNRSVTFEKPAEYLFYDPFSGMYVIKANNHKYYRFYDGAKLGWWMAYIKNNSLFGGTYAKAPYLLHFAKNSVNGEKNSIVSDIFCRAYGVSNGEEFLTKKYLFHFVRYGYWGDIGLEVDENLIVKSVDPFYVKGIKPYDKIVKINGKRASAELFTKYVILGVEGNEVSVSTPTKTVKLRIRKKEYLFTPLEHFGIKVDKNLFVKKMPKTLKSRFFPDKPVKIVKINSKKVENFEDLLRALSYSTAYEVTFLQSGIEIKVKMGR